MKNIDELKQEYFEKLKALFANFKVALISALDSQSPPQEDKNGKTHYHIREEDFKVVNIQFEIFIRKYHEFDKLLLGLHNNCGFWSRESSYQMRQRYPWIVEIDSLFEYALAQMQGSYLGNFLRAAMWGNDPGSRKHKSCTGSPLVPSPIDLEIKTEKAHLHI